MDGVFWFILEVLGIVDHSYRLRLELVGRSVEFRTGEKDVSPGGLIGSGRLDSIDQNL